MKKKTVLSIAMILTLIAPSTVMAANTVSNNIYNVSLNLVREKAYKNVAERINDLVQRAKTYILDTGDFSPTTEKIAKFYKTNINTWRNLDKNGTLQIKADNRNNRFVITNIGSIVSSNEKQAKIFLSNNVLNPMIYARTNPRTKKIELPLTLYKSYGAELVSFKNLYNSVASKPNTVISPTPPENTAYTWYKPDGKGNFEEYVYTEGKWKEIGEKRNSMNYFESSLVNPKTNQGPLIASSYKDLLNYNNVSNGTVGYVVNSETNTSVPYVFANGTWMPLLGGETTNNVADNNNNNNYVNGFIAWNDNKKSILYYEIYPPRGGYVHINFIKINGHFFPIGFTGYMIVRDIQRGRYGLYIYPKYGTFESITGDETVYFTSHNPGSDSFAISLNEAIKKHLISPFQSFAERLEKTELSTIDTAIDKFSDCSMIGFTNNSYKVVKFPYNKSNKYCPYKITSAYQGYQNYVLNKISNIVFPYNYSYFPGDNLLVNYKNNKSIIVNDSAHYFTNIPNNIIIATFSKGLSKFGHVGIFPNYAIISGEMLIAKNGNIYALFKNSVKENENTFKQTVENLLKNRSYSTNNNYIDKTTFKITTARPSFYYAFVKINPFEKPDEKPIEVKKVYNNGTGHEDYLFVTNKGNLYVLSKSYKPSHMLKKIDTNVMYAMPINVHKPPYLLGILAIKKDGTADLFIKEDSTGLFYKNYVFVKSFNLKTTFGGIESLKKIVNPNNVMDITNKAIFYKDGTALTLDLGMIGQPNTIKLMTFKIDKSKLSPDIFRFIRKNQLVIDINGNIIPIAMSNYLLLYSSGKPDLVTTALKADFPKTPLQKLVLISKETYIYKYGRYLKDKYLLAYSPIEHKICRYWSLLIRSPECINNVKFFYILHSYNVLYYNSKNKSFNIMKLNPKTGVNHYTSVTFNGIQETTTHCLFTGLQTLNNFAKTQKNINFEFFVPANKYNINSY